MTKRLCAVLLVLAWGTFTTAAKVPLIEFVQRPVVVSPVVSPNGRYLAVAKAGEDRKKAVIAVLDLDAPNVKPTIALAVEHAVVDWVRWANDDRLLMGLTNAQIIKDKGVLQFGFSRAAPVDRRGGPFAVLFNNQRWLKYTQDLTEVVHPLPLEPNYVLMVASDEYLRNNLYRVNVVDGKSELLHRAGPGARITGSRIYRATRAFDGTLIGRAGRATFSCGAAKATIGML